MKRSMKLTRENIEQYIERFLDGRTTCAEEQALYDYFRNENIPPEWEYLRDAFAYFESGMREEEMGMPALRPARLTLPRSGMVSWLTARKAARWFAAASITAMAATGIWLGISSDTAVTDGMTSLYDGSYVILNGRYCNDIETIDYQIDIALERAEVMTIKAERLLAAADCQPSCKTM